MRSQVPAVFPEDIRILQFIPTGNLYAVEKDWKVSGRWAHFTAFQCVYDPVDDDITIGPAVYIEEPLVIRWVPDAFGTPIQKMQPERWTRHIDWRRVDPEIVLAFQKILQTPGEKKSLSWFKDENVEGWLRKNKIYQAMGPATTGANPEVIPEPKTQIIKPVSFGRNGGG